MNFIFSYYFLECFQNYLKKKLPETGDGSRQPCCFSMSFFIQKGLLSDVRIFHPKIGRTLITLSIFASFAIVASSTLPSTSMRLYAKSLRFWFIMPLMLNFASPSTEVNFDTTPAMFLFAMRSEERR